MKPNKWILVNLLHVYLSFMQTCMCVEIVTYCRRIVFNRTDIPYFNMLVFNSLDDCVNECSSRTSCEFMNYNIRSRTCILAGPYTSYNMTEDQRYIAVIMDGSNANGAGSCTHCGPQMMCAANDTTLCINEVCGPAPTLPYSTRTGNLRTIGSQVVYTCLYSNTMRVTSQCQTNATWSPVVLFCPGPPTTTEPTTTVDPSSENWILCEGILFAVTETRYSWRDGKTHCESFGGIFAELTSMAIGTCIADYYEANYRSNTLWIGASDLDGDSILEWTSGKEATGVGYGLANPVEGKCIYLETSEVMWEVDNCELDYKVVCQR